MALVFFLLAQALFLPPPPPTDLNADANAAAAATASLRAKAAVKPKLDEAGGESDGVGAKLPDDAAGKTPSGAGIRASTGAASETGAATAKRSSAAREATADRITPGAKAGATVPACRNPDRARTRRKIQVA